MSGNLGKRIAFSIFCLVISTIIFMSSVLGNPEVAFARNGIGEIQSVNDLVTDSKGINLEIIRQDNTSDLDSLDIPIFPDLVVPGGSKTIKTVNIPGFSPTTQAIGTYYISEPVKTAGKPSIDLMQYYFPDNLKIDQWNFVNFEDEPGGIGIFYYREFDQRYLRVKIYECVADKGIEFPFCVSFWVSEKDQSLAPILSDKTTSSNPAQDGLRSSYPNPLNVPFYSQRNSDPNKNTILGYGSCTSSIYNYGCALTAYAMIYNYYQPNYKSVIELNNSMKVSPGTYFCNDGCCNLWPQTAPDSPSGVSFGVRKANNSTAANTIDAANIPIIDAEISAGRPIHARVHKVGGYYNSHSIVIVGHVGDNYYIKDPWATDDTQRTLATGALGAYVVDFIDTINGTPPGGGIPLPPDTTFCANQGGYCSFSGTATVYYGVNNSYFYKENIIDGIACTNVVFGNPVSGLSKACYYKITSQPCNPNDNQAALYENSNYGGACVVKNIGSYSNSGSIGISNDSVSSVKVGSNVKLTICQKDEYLGTCETFKGDDADLSNNSIGDNQGSSAKVQIRAVKPATPANFRVTGESADSVSLTWDDVSGETGYKIYKWDYQDEVWEFYYLTAVGANVTTFSDDGLDCGSIQYFYQVSAYNAAGESDRANWVKGTTAACASPDSPTGVSATDATYTEKVRIQWDASYSATSYDVYRNTINSSSTAVKVGTTTTTSYDDLDVLSGKPYFYFVQACLSSNCSPFSAADAGYRAFTANVPITKKPWGTIYETTPTFQWTKVSNAAKYRYQVYNGTTLVYTRYSSSAVCGNAYCNPTPAALPGYTKYKWRVSAYVDDVWKPWSVYKYFTISSSGLPE